MKLLLILISILFTMTDQADAQNENYETAVLGAGCFWCVEAIYQRVNGVVAVESGYAGGHVENPTYNQVVSGNTGHAEVAKVTFDPNEISFDELLEVFWHTHDPTTLNRQGADVGTQYRSAIFFNSLEQKKIAEESLKRTDESDLWDSKIVTEITPLSNYSTAEDYHQNYFNNNPNAGYCSVVIAPKLAKFKKDFPHLLQESL
ncbi:peptide-methionine (S)-S-oxide reductase MsrA [Rhodohalobacter barkolensis]|uniref:Peptide methionine sulfoxide reductase MsrA n=1 Tax=Rhodohalobacter barkolensis TaxID=2053187 RepID=A0A2N0VLV9_9BACT|nr:peptide-methionine (S)-S-oxide reductase MsrA [Rhodohalobacter barkolensis]PKD45178.1 peptide-methionine (S)-S-oxide reductase [Rhodohalobacter barkolensis]